ncbi:fatty acid desaturase [Coxiella burnetii]
MKQISKINWLNVSFIILTGLVGITGTILFIVFGLVHWPTWVLAGAMLIACGLSITAGYHRLAAHKSYKAAWPIRLFFALFGAAAFEGSIVEWATDHRKHHRYTDTDQDPYSIKKGFWYAHIGWLFTLDPSKRDFSNVQDLLDDPIYRFQHRFFPIIAILMGFGLPMAIGALWGDPLSALVIAGALRITVVYQMTFCINYICPMIGKQTYKNSSARDNWVTALLTMGEGFHNFHHQFPIDYRNGVRFFHFDPTKWLIYLLSRMGLVSGLKRVEQRRIIKYRLETDTQRLALLSAERVEVVKPLYERIHHLLGRLEELEKSYLALKEAQFKAYKNRLREIRQKLKATERELRTFLTLWSKVARPLQTCQLSGS